MTINRFIKAVPQLISLVGHNRHKLFEFAFDVQTPQLSGHLKGLATVCGWHDVSEVVQA